MKIMYVKCGAYYKLIWNQSNDQLPVGLLAQLVEGCTGITEDMDSKPVQAWIFNRPNIFTNI